LKLRIKRTFGLSFAHNEVVSALLRQDLGEAVWRARRAEGNCLTRKWLQVAEKRLVAE
jgi:hypothetical protein